MLIFVAVQLCYTKVQFGMVIMQYHYLLFFFFSTVQLCCNAVQCCVMIMQYHYFNVYFQYSTVVL